MKKRKTVIIPIITAAAMLMSGFALAGDTEPMDGFVKMNSGVSAEMMNAEFWINNAHNADDEVMSYEEIAAWNEENPNTVSVGDNTLSIYEMGSTVKGSIVRELIESITPPAAGEAYIKGKPVTQEYIDELCEQRNLDAIPKKVSAKYGFSVKRRSLRTFPTNDFAGEEPTDYFYDTLAMSEYMPFRPLRVLHESSDGKWYFVMFDSFAGWVEKKYVAICDSKKDWLERQQPKDFLVVTGRELRLPDDAASSSVSGLILPMGTKMELVRYEDAPSKIRGRSSYANYIVKIPTADKNGMIKDKYVLVPVSEDVHVGYVKYTHGNVIRLAAELLGDRYGWAGLANSNDCSGVVREVYSCFGFEFPRTSGTLAAMENMGAFRFDESSSDADKLEVLRNAPIGSLVQFRGHIMIYLGMVDDEPYVISAVGTFYERSGGKKIDTNTMMINSLTRTYRSNGKSWLSNIVAILYCESEK